MTSDTPTGNLRGQGVVRLLTDAVDWREVEGEIVALDRSESVYLAINPAGAALWPAMVQGATVDELVTILLEHFDVQPGQARADVSAFVAELDGRKLLER